MLDSFESMFGELNAEENKDKVMVIQERIGYVYRKIFHLEFIE